MEETNIPEAIVQWMTESVRVAVEAMAAARAENSTRHYEKQDWNPK